MTRSIEGEKVALAASGAWVGTETCADNCANALATARLPVGGGGAATVVEGLTATGAPTGVFGLAGDFTAVAVALTAAVFAAVLEAVFGVVLDAVLAAALGAVLAAVLGAVLATAFDATGFAWVTLLLAAERRLVLTVTFVGTLASDFAAVLAAPLA